MGYAPIHSDTADADRPARFDIQKEVPMPAPSKYTLADLNAVFSLPLVNATMHAPFTVNSTHFDVPDLIGYSADFSTFYVARIMPHWSFLGQLVPVTRFLMMRSQVERALDMAFATEHGAIEGAADEQERLCMLLRMTGPDDNRRDNIVDFARECEDYAVRMLHGESGVASYRQWLTSIPKHRDSLPPDLAHSPAEVNYTLLAD